MLHTHASPRSAVGFLIHAAGLTREQLGPRINLTMPGVCCTVGEQIEALRRIAGDKVAARIRREPDELVVRIVAGWPQRFDAKRARCARLPGRSDVRRDHPRPYRGRARRQDRGVSCMRFPAPLIPATLVKRYKRFLADVMLPSGETITAHVANPGAMTGLAAPGARVWLSKSDNPNRKLPYTWELVEVDLGGGLELVGVNTGHPNALVAEALAAARSRSLPATRSIRREVKYGKNSRVDFLLEEPGAPALLRRDQERAPDARSRASPNFPTAVTERGAKHLDELADMVAAGARAVMLYLIQIGSADRFALARDIDPAYGAAFDRARAAGVEAIAWRCTHRAARASRSPRRSRLSIDAAHACAARRYALH